MGTSTFLFNTNGGGISAFIAVVVAVGAFLVWLINFIGKPNPKDTDTFSPIPEPAAPVEIKVSEPAMKGGLLKISLTDYEARIAKKKQETEANLTTAQDEE
ncbi:MAG: hypothetical protein QNK92_05620 [Amylibacter sp.]